ncbi:MAG: siderophore-mediated iron transporter [Epsilonproteobacteria bacterium]|nr:siderophore-mediated iron transporter [Campylobacterota bacterium]NPA65206.1 energy transducer TonB [Campylobacterota bacterium]
MKRTVKAFFITLVLYIALALIFMIDLQTKPRKLPPRSTLSLTNLRLIQPPKPAPAQPRQKAVKKPTPKPRPKPKPKPTPKPKPKPVKKPQKIKKRIAKRKKPIKQKKRVLKKIVKKTKKSDRNATMPTLDQLFAKSAPQKSALSSLPPDLQKLYKDDYATFTKNQKRFIQDNLAKIAQITQKYLYLRGYPYVAIKTRQEGINAVEFILHPNGDITNLRLLSSSGYEALDKNSIETIKTAYKDYPRPKEPTKIRINVRYSIIY